MERQMSTINRPSTIQEPHACKAINNLLKIAELYNLVHQYLLHTTTHQHCNGLHGGSTQAKLVSYQLLAAGVASFPMAMVTCV